MAWTIRPSLYRRLRYKNDQEMFVIKFHCVSDASASGDIDLRTYLQTAEGSTGGTDLMSDIEGGSVYAVKYDPDGTAVPASAATITLDDETGEVVFSGTVGTAANPESWDGAVTKGYNPPFIELVLASTTLGNADEADIYIWILR